MSSAPNLIALISQNKQYENHRRKIETIMTKNSQSLSFRKNDEFGSFHSSKDRSKRYNQRVKQQEVDKLNDLMLKKIIEANRRSQSQALVANKKDLSHNNLSNLKKKLEKTNQQNQKLANKLVLATSNLSQNILNQDYRRHAQIKQRIKKYIYDEETGMIVPKKIKSLVRMNQLQPLREQYSSRVENRVEDKV